MRKIFYKTIFLLSLTMAISSCGTSDLEYKDAKLTAVTILSIPLDAASITLLNTSASETFEWSPATASDSLPPFYEVVFAKTNGDLSKPFYRVTSAKTGITPSVKIGHKILNVIADSAGIAPGATGTIKWAVMTSRGIGGVVGTSRTLTLKRFL